MRTVDTAYIERANGRFEAWTYSDGERLYIAHRADRIDLAIYLMDRGFFVVEV